MSHSIFTTSGMTTKNSIGYLRCSTETQEDSTRQQRDEIQRFADRNGYNVLHWFEDFGLSGTTFIKRPEFMRMVEAAASGHADFQFILVYDESRWGRADDPEENAYWENKFRFEFGIKVVLVHTMANTENALANSVLKSIQRAESSEYSKKLSRSTLRGAKDNAQRGNSNGGSAPYGYIRVAISKDTNQVTRVLPPGEHIRPQEEKARYHIGQPSEVLVVRRIFEERIKGSGYVAIANGLNRDQIPPPQRGRWRNRDQKWSGTTVKTILENPAYYGAVVYNRHPQSHLTYPDKDRWQNDKENWIIVENAHEPTVSKEMFELANRDRRPYHRLNRHHYDSPYLLSGLIKCSHCGFNMQGQSQTNRRGKTKIRYYEDSGYVSKGRSVCTSFKINAMKLESFVIRAIRTKILNSQLPKVLESELQRRTKLKSVERLGSIESTENQLHEVKKKIDRLLTLAENGVALEEQIDRLKQAEKEKNNLERLLEDLRVAGLSREESTKARDQVEYLMNHFEESLSTASLANQKELLRRCVHSIVVERSTGDIMVNLRKIPQLSDSFKGSAEMVTVVKRDRNKVSAAETSSMIEATETQTDVQPQD